MVSAAAIVVVLLHLHASDTLKEDNEKASSAQTTTNRARPHGSKSTSSRIHHDQGDLWRRDEDLLDLMVRIAETPEEWERIHRVLSLIGSETESYDNDKNDQKTQYRQDEDRKNITANFSSGSQNESHFRTTTVTNIEPSTMTSSTTLPPVTTSPALVKETDESTFNYENMDTGWPDFEEAIFKKVKKPHTVEENILESNWLEDDWLDANWNNYLNKDESNHITSTLPKSVSTVSESKTASKTPSDVPKSRLYRDPKILEFRLRDEIALQNHTVEPNTTDANDTSSHGARPVFVYHRVTTSPQERRGQGAFIAVSVVRQSPPATTSTTTTQQPESAPPRWDHLRRIQDPMKDSSLSKHQKKHPHWRQGPHRQHNRGRRHHRPHH